MELNRRPGEPAYGSCALDECDYVGKLVRVWCMKHYKRWYKTGDPQKIKDLPTPYDRVVRNGYILVPETECFIYRGRLGPKGYGKVSQKAVHRIVFETWHELIPEGLLIDHVCHNEAAASGLCSGGNDCIHRACINPGHLRAVTPAENTSASVLTAAGSEAQQLVGTALLNKTKTECKRGHAFSEENTRFEVKPATGAVRRICKACKREKAREERAAKLANRGG